MRLPSLRSSSTAAAGRPQPFVAFFLLLPLALLLLPLLAPGRALAQSIDLLSNISPSCASQLEQQYFSRDLADCLNFRGQASFPVAFFSAGKGASSLNGVGRYLEKTLCARPACPPTALSTTYSAVTSSCTSTDLSGPTSAPGFFATFLQIYSGFRDSACLYDKGPSGGPRAKEGCWVGMLRAMEETKGVLVDQETLFGLLMGNLTVVKRVTGTSVRGQQEKEKTAVCTDCTKALYLSLFKTQHTQSPVVNANATESLVKSYLTSLCGASFLQEPINMPVNIVQGAVKGSGIGVMPGQSTNTGLGVTGGMNPIQHGGHPMPDNATTLPSPAANDSSKQQPAVQGGNGGYNSSDVALNNAPVVGNNVTTLPSAAVMSFGEALEFALVFDAVIFVVLFVVTVPLLVH